MPKFKINISRSLDQSLLIDIDADTSAEAQRIVIDNFKRGLYEKEEWNNDRSNQCTYYEDVTEDYKDEWYGFFNSIF